MGFLTLLKGKSPEEIVATGDAFYQTGEYGAAKLEYEKALHKLAKHSMGKPLLIKHVQQKLIDSKEALARSHIETAENLLETGHWDEAEDILTLALELTVDEELEHTIHAIRERVEQHHVETVRNKLSEHEDEDIPVQTEEMDLDEDEYHTALLNTLSDEERLLYSSYGDAFKKGFVALNQGDFEVAAASLSQALEENKERAGYIRFELATALLNLNHQDEAFTLLNAFLDEYPNVLKAYALICEILWDRKEFDQALERLKACPEEHINPVAHLLLWGETLFQAERYAEAERLFRGFIQSHGWEENVARSLAKVYEAKNEPTNARNLYREIMQSCQTCRRSADTFIRRKVADMGFDAGEHSIEVLELYLSLAQDDPEHRGDYYERISTIYTSLGNETEAQRFRAFAREHKE